MLHLQSRLSGSEDSLRSVEFVVVDTGRKAAALNMAVDEALLEAMPRLRKSVLRFYRWTESAASFGYFQKYAAIERLTLLRPLVRRPTGGGLVPHDGDWTYSVVIPTCNEWYKSSATESYKRMHEWIRAAFAKLGLATELASDCRKPEPGQCFVGHEKSDLLWHGKKVAGAAQRRTRTGLLIQGSVQPPQVSVDYRQWKNAMCEARLEGEVCESSELDQQLLARAQELLANKYSQQSYNQKK